MNDRMADADLMVLREVRRIVEEARKGSILCAGHCADQIMQAFPTSAFTRNEIADEIMMTAAEAGIPVQFGSAQD